MTNNIIEIETVRPSSSLGGAVIEGYVNDSSFRVTIYQDTHALDYITMDNEIVWADDITQLDEPIVNPINTELLSEFVVMVATQIRTIRVSR